MPAASLHLQQGLAVQSKRRPGQQHLSDSSLPQCRHPLRHGTPYQQLCRSAPASSCATAPWPAKAPPRRPIASNKPHPAEKSTPVWLAIWRTWAGFANSQLLPDAAALSSMQGLPRSGNSSAQTSASLHPPAALRLRCLPFTRDMGVHGLCGRVPDSAGNVSSWPGAAFLQITARTNPCSRHLWGTLARSVASI